MEQPASKNGYHSGYQKQKNPQISLKGLLSSEDKTNIELFYQRSEGNRRFFRISCSPLIFDRRFALFFPTFIRCSKTHDRSGILYLKYDLPHPSPKKLW